jgi:hypothetical protein
MRLRDRFRGNPPLEIRCLKGNSWGRLVARPAKAAENLASPKASWQDAFDTEFFDFLVGKNPEPSHAQPAYSSIKSYYPFWSYHDSPTPTLSLEAIGQFGRGFFDAAMPGDSGFVKPVTTIGFLMIEPVVDARAVIHRLAFELTIGIELNYVPDEMAECAMHLVPLYQARAFGPLPEDVERVIALIEKKVVTIPHFACAGCKALFLDTDDLGSVAVSNICDAKTGEPAIGSCPVCGSEVWPRTPMA